MCSRNSLLLGLNIRLANSITAGSLKVQVKWGYSTYNAFSGVLYETTLTSESNTKILRELFTRVPDNAVIGIEIEKSDPFPPETSHRRRSRRRFIHHSAPPPGLEELLPLRQRKSGTDPKIRQNRPRYRKLLQDSQNRDAFRHRRHRLRLARKNHRPATLHGKSRKVTTRVLSPAEVLNFARAGFSPYRVAMILEVTPTTFNTALKNANLTAQYYAILKGATE